MFYAILSNLQLPIRDLWLLLRDLGSHTYIMNIWHVQNYAELVLHVTRFAKRDHIPQILILEL